MAALQLWCVALATYEWSYIALTDQVLTTLTLFVVQLRETSTHN